MFSMTKIYFNSNMVRLRQLLHSLEQCVDLFQFQYGAIKTSELRDLTRFIYDFNSNMVRLRRRHAVHHVAAHAHFNSNMVRLRPKD